MDNILIYRHQLFRPSEGFILQQTKHLKNFQPVFTGRTITENHPYSGLKTKTIQELGSYQAISHRFTRHSKAFYQSLMEENPSLIHAHFGVEGVYALPLAKKLAIPLVTTFHGFDATCSRRSLLFSRKISWINYLFYRHQLAKQGDLFICVSQFIKDKLIKIGFPEDKLLLHYIGIDLEEIKPSNIKKSYPVILHVARLVEKKGTAYLLKAFVSVQKKYSDVRLVIIGEGPLSSSLHKLAIELGIINYVQFLGIKSPYSVIEWMQKSSIFCLPSIEAKSGDSEALGMVFLEAAACELPVVATHHGGIPEVVKENQTGFLVPEKNPLALAERLIYLLDQHSLREKMGLQARKLAEGQFNLKHQTALLEKIYRRLIT